ncbi:MAG TPA: hypothetical protein VF332_06660 [Vicinamibacterales bacterium]
MLTCDREEALVVREADGLVTPEEQRVLASHVAVCERCHALRDANLAVKRALALRVDAPVPNGFAARVSARIGPARPVGRLDEVDWRRWTEWMLPIAAALLLVVGTAGSNGGTSTATTPTPSGESSAAALESWPLTSDTEATLAASALAQGLTSDELLAAMLGTREVDAEGKVDGR